MTAFNADAVIESLGKPSVVIDGTTYIGKPISVMEWMTFLKRIDDIKQSVDHNALLEIYKDIIKKMFPSKWYQINKPASKIINHPALLQIVQDFLVIQNRYMEKQNQN